VPVLTVLFYSSLSYSPNHLFSLQHFSFFH
jgi:hypothetical protein